MLQPEDAFEALFECIAPFNDIDSVKPDIIVTDMDAASSNPAKRSWGNLTPEKTREYATTIAQSSIPKNPGSVFVPGIFQCGGSIVDSVWIVLCLAD